MPAIRNQKFGVIDFETGGTAPEQCAVTEFSVFWFFFPETEDVPQPLYEQSDKIRPKGNLTICPEALSVQGVSAKEVFDYTGDEALSFHTFRTRFESLGKPPLIAHDASFEEGFLSAMAKRSGGDPKEVARRGSFICTQRMTAYARGIGCLPPGGNSLNEALAAFGLRRADKSHDSAEDTYLTAVLFVKLHNALKAFLTDGTVVVPPDVLLTAAGYRKAAFARRLNAETVRASEAVPITPSEPAPSAPAKTGFVLTVPSEGTKITPWNGGSAIANGTNGGGGLLEPPYVSAEPAPVLLPPIEEEEQVSGGTPPLPAAPGTEAGTN
jgi:DNA polymerase III epsilon subunit-like protein